MSRYGFGSQSLLVTGLTLGAAFSSHAFAQDATPAPSSATAAQSPEPKKVERIEVTGSRIKRIDTEGTSPVTTIDRAEIDRSGATSVRELLSSFSGSDAAFDGGGASVAGGVATISLRGFGANRTLVLVDGIRLPKHPELGAVDLNSLPLAAIERVDVLNQSAAAIYGSDAIGGVVNIITRKNYEGGQVQIQASQPTKKGGEHRTISGVVGINSDNFNSTLVLSVDQQEILYTKQRDFSRDRVSGIGSPGTYAATVAGKDVSFAAPGCPGATGTPVEGSPCTYNYNEYNTLRPALNRYSGLYNFDYKLNSDLDLTGKIIATRQYSRSQLRHESNSGQEDTISQAAVQQMDDTRFNSLFPGLGAKPDAGGILIRTRLTDLGLSVTEKQADMIGGNIGLGGVAGEGWDWKVNLSSGKSVTHSKSSNKIRQAEFANLITSGGFIPWDPARDLGSLKAQLLTDSRYTEATGTSGLEASVTSQIGSIGNKPISFALSTGVLGETYKINYNDASSSLSLINIAGAGGKGDRTVTYFAAEVALPLASTVELDLSARLDDYSDFGSTVNPQAAFSYAPLKALKFRGSLGTAFKAPTLDELHGAAGSSYNPVTDNIYCAAHNISQKDCESNTVTTAAAVKNIRRGNSDLDPETSVVYSAGFVIQPADPVTVSADYWKITSKDMIERRELQDLVDEQDPLVHRDPNTQMIVDIDYPLQNLNKLIRSGVDVSATYVLTTGGIATSFRSTGTWNLEVKEEPKGKPMQNKLGENGNNKWKLSNEFTMDFAKTYGFTLGSSTLGTHQKSNNNGERLPQYTRFDGQVRYVTPWKSDVALGAINLLNKQGGVDSTVQGDVDSTLYDINGREFYLRLTQNF